MKIIVYAKRCMFCLIMFFLTYTLSAQHDLKEAIAKHDTISESSLSGKQQTDGTLTTTEQLRSCVNSFMNQTVSSHQIVYGCNNLLIQNVKVLSGGYLSLAAPGEIIINGAFDVMKGGACDLGLASAPTPPVSSTFQYLYDASGNRIARRLSHIKVFLKEDKTDENDTETDTEENLSGTLIYSN